MPTLRLTLPLLAVLLLGRMSAVASADEGDDDAPTTAPVVAEPTPEAAPVLDWPRHIVLPEGEIIIYQPQLESFTGTRLEARSAISVKTPELEQPVFGAVWFDAQVETDRDRRLVELVGVGVAKSLFPGAEPDQLDRLESILVEEITAWSPTVPLDHILTALELAEVEERTETAIQSTPPNIIFKTHPTILVMIDGIPDMRRISGTELLRVVNTPVLIVLDPESQSFYMTGAGVWVASSDVAGPWRFIETPPETVAALVETSGEPARIKQMPQILVKTEPTEVIVTDGDPAYEVIEDTSLLIVTNTEANLVLDIESQRYFVLLSGRWYASASLKGGWALVEPEGLPDDFYRIPQEADFADVRAAIPGTDEAIDAVNDTYIPQTAAIDRNATIEVTYDGEPAFEAIDGTSITFAANTADAVFEVDGVFYCCRDAVWFTAEAPVGPWSVCVAVPDEIYTVPPSCPHYNVRYVHVYDSTPEIAYVGYTTGYVGSYVSGGTVVYGTGYVYRGWRGAVYYPRPVTWGYAYRYDAVSSTWWMGPGRGVTRVRAVAGPAGGAVAASGPNGAVAITRGPAGYRGVAVGPSGGIAVAHHGGWWGPAGYRGARDIEFERTVSTPRGTYSSNVDIERDWDGDLEAKRTIEGPGGRGVEGSIDVDRDWDGDVEAKRTIEGSGGRRLEQGLEIDRDPGETTITRTRESGAGKLEQTIDLERDRYGNIDVDRSVDWQPNENLYDRANNRQRTVDTREARAAGSSGRGSRSMASSSPNNVFADGDGNVYRKTNGGWERRGANGWSRTTTPGGGRSSAGTPSRPRDSGSGTSRNRSSSNSRSLDRASQSRQRAAARTRSFQSRGRSGGRGGRR